MAVAAGDDIDGDTISSTISGEVDDNEDDSNDMLLSSVLVVGTVDELLDIDFCFDFDARLCFGSFALVACT